MFEKYAKQKNKRKMVKEIREEATRLHAQSNWLEFAREMWDDEDGLVIRNGELRHSERNDLTYMTLRGFIHEWVDELCDYYGEEFRAKDNELITDSAVGDTVILCMVDNDENAEHLPEETKKKIRKAGKWRRDKLKHQWSYINPMNRIHGYIILNDVSTAGRGRKTLSISAVCSTYFTKKKGIGSDLMDFAKEYATKMGCFDIVLEVANEYSGMGLDYSDDSDDTDDSDDSDDSDDYDDDDYSDDSDDSDDEEWLTPWMPCESGLAILSEELWKKCMRKNVGGNPQFNLEQEYIEDSIRDYMSADYNSGDASVPWEGTGKRVRSNDEPGETEYGGFWYHKGRNSQERLMKFYEKHGYTEEADVHFNWRCFSEIPYPTMRLELE